MTKFQGEIQEDIDETIEIKKFRARIEVQSPVWAYVCAYGATALEARDEAILKIKMKLRDKSIKRESIEIEIDESQE